MGIGAKIALGCGCLVLAGAVVAAGACGLLGYWAQGKAEGIATDFERMANRAGAVTDEIESWEQKANANPYEPPADGVIAEPRLLKFLEVRKQVFAVYEAHEADLRALEEASKKPSEKVGFTEMWNAGGKLAELFGALRLAQVKGLAEAGMSEAEYRDIQLAVYKSAWASTAEKETGQMPAEAVESAMAEAGRQMNEAMEQGVEGAKSAGVPGSEKLSPEDLSRLGAELAEAGKAAKALEVPKANVELFRKHEAEIRKYAMTGLGFMGL
jgi:hypothetical protein